MKMTVAFPSALLTVVVMFLCAMLTVVVALDIRDESFISVADHAMNVDLLLMTTEDAEKVRCALACTMMDGCKSFSSAAGMYGTTCMMYSSNDLVDTVVQPGNTLYYIQVGEGRQASLI